MRGSIIFKRKSVATAKRPLLLLVISLQVLESDPLSLILDRQPKATCPTHFSRRLLTVLSFACTARVWATAFSLASQGKRHTELIMFWSTAECIAGKKLALHVLHK